MRYRVTGIIAVIAIVVLFIFHEICSDAAIDEFERSVSVGMSKNIVLEISDGLYFGLRKVYYTGDGTYHVDLGKRYPINQKIVRLKIVGGFVIDKQVAGY